MIVLNIATASGRTRGRTRSTLMMRVPSRGSQGDRAPRSAHSTRNVYSQLSGREDVVFNDFIKDDFIPEGDGSRGDG